ncbi:MAG: HAD family hydrolase [Candidatus Melainabacteria bacterium]|nr:HAD family hydrolase [Candidatus Melainabacteria bacterium]
MVIQFPDVDLTGIKGVLLDLDNCLYAYDACHAAALEACIKLLEEKFSETSREELLAAYDKSRKTCHQELDGTASSHSRLLYFSGVVEDISSRTDAALTLELEELYWSTYMDTMELDSKALDFLKQCQAQSIPICLVTDLTLQTQLRKVVKLGISDYIQFITSSEEAGLEKPAAKIFELALSKLGLKTDEVIMIGDNPKKDIAGAQALNIKAYQVSS